MRTLNLGVLAHVDAGKTSLTERLLYAGGAIDAIGSVDAGSTQTDSLALERSRGITIRSAVASFAIGDLAVNLIDTPGHPDFIAEVERVLSVLDGAVLVVSAVEGVQPQTRVLMRALRRLRVPTVIFVNKIDRRGAQHAPLLQAIADRLTPTAVAMGATQDLGERAARFLPYGCADTGFASRLLDVLTVGDAQLLSEFIEDEAAVTYAVLRAELARQTDDAKVHPVFFGSAITGAGIDALMAGARELLPAAVGDPHGQCCGTVFKIERGAAGEKIAYVRMFAGTIRTRDVLPLGAGRADKVTAIAVFEGGAATRRASVTAGEIGRLWGLDSARVGDAVGDAVGEGQPLTGRPAGQGHFPPPSLETVVLPRRRADRGALHSALTQLAEQDPLINVRLDDLRHETSVSLYGEVQKEVIAATLTDDFGVEVDFRETTTICIERPVGIGSSVQYISVAPNPFLATVGLRIGPGPIGSGLTYRLGVELGSMPSAFMSAVEDTVRRTCENGLFGWQVTDCTVTLTHSGYWARQSSAHGGFDKSSSSTAGDFRGLTPLVLLAALREAGTRVFEPVHSFRLEIPPDSVRVVLPVLAALRAAPDPPAPYGRSYVVTGHIPAARIHQLGQRLPTLTSGEGVLESAFDHFRAVRGEPPTRARSAIDR